MKPRLWPLLLASGIAVAVLVSLGVWQVQRLAQKQALIAAYEAAASAPPIPALDAIGKVIDGADVNYMRVTAQGELLPHPQFMVTSFDGLPGWTVIAALRIDPSLALLVDLGQVPEDQRNRISMPEGRVTLTGPILRHDSAQGSFEPDNDPKTASWYWWDLPALAAAATAGEKVTVPPFVLHLAPEAALANGPVPRSLKVNLRNNHLGYAITWFGLAAVLVVMTIIFAIRLRKHA